jgi:Holliday junction resolvase
MATAYRRGYNFEDRCRRALEGQGYVVVRSAGSKGPADLVAMRGGVTLLVQCKLDRRLMGRGERLALLEAAARAGAIPVLAEREKKRGPIRWVRLDGEGNAEGLVEG